MSYYGVSPLETVVSGLQELLGPQDLPLENTKCAYNTKFMSLYSEYILNLGSERVESAERTDRSAVYNALTCMVNKMY